MATRSPVAAGTFYPATGRECRQRIEQFLDAVELPTLPDRLMGGVVPHAGWVYSGGTAAHVYAALQKHKIPDTVVILGAVHRHGVSQPTVFPAGSWLSPLGSISIDGEMVSSLTEQGKHFVADAAAHRGEHSIEVQVPFLQVIYPETPLLPIAMPPTSDAIDAGMELAQVINQMEREVIVLASSDLTHYGPNYGLVAAGAGQPAIEWTHCNDRRILDLMVAMQAEQVLVEARQHHNACGSAAVAAAIACCEALGADQGLLLDYTTSHEVLSSGRARNLVGYGAVLFGGA